MGLNRRTVVVTTAVAFALGAGVGAIARGPSADPERTPRVASPNFDSPTVTGLAIDEARRILNDAGYDVMVVGRGKVALQELGFEGQLLEIKGDRSGPRRYCAAAGERCVLVEA